MSRLSELLNPAPHNGPQSSSPTQQPLIDADGAIPHPEDDQSIPSTIVFPGNAPRRQSITSPLDALAAAATSSAPMPSSSRSATNFVDAHHPTLPAPLTRPTSSHASPPRSFELPPVPQNPGHFSPGLEQYHQATSEEVKARRMSNDMVGDTLRVLPPLTQIQPEKESLAAIVNARSHNDGGEQNHLGALGPASRSPENKQPTSPSEVRSQVPEQIRQPSLGPSESIPDPALPNIQTEQVQVKTEVTDVPSHITEMTNQKSAQAASSPATNSRRPSATADGPPISKSIADLKNEASYQPSLVTTNTEASTRNTSEKSKAPPSKKRAAPKKGTASAMKPAAKKRKIETTKTESVASSPALPRNGTPASSRASKTPAPKNQKQGSETPARSSSVLKSNEDEDDDDMDIDENEQFCICRGPDDHTWMIACDGGCDDWFHGRCVNMDEKDGKLIDKYICTRTTPSWTWAKSQTNLPFETIGPNCTSANRGQTLWKPMCRLPTCRKPARVDTSKPSKYCSDEHGVEFMRELAFRNEPPSSPKKPQSLSPTGRRKSRKDYSDAFDSAGFEDPNDEEGGACLRGGILRHAELKTLASSINSAAEFCKLGEGVLAADAADDNNNNNNPPMNHTPDEVAQLAEIKTKTSALKERKRMLDDKDAFLGMVKARLKSVLEELKKKGEKGAASVCGFDSRLAWADEEFEVWRASEEGKSIFTRGNLGPVLALKDDTKNKKAAAVVVNGHTDEGEKEEVEEEGEQREVFCTKKGCRRHKDWLRVQTNNVALDKESVRVDMKRLLAEEKALRERGLIRGLEEG
ncbi:MAG: hypothetical protein Q9195_009434 [Heterodermia aff. obscurata]